jgi:comEA protein
MFFKKISESLYRFFLTFGLTRQEMYVVLLLSALAVVGASIPYAKNFLNTGKEPVAVEIRERTFREYSRAMNGDEELSVEQKDSLIALLIGDSTSASRWRSQSDSLKKLLSANPRRESVDSFFTQLQDAPLRRLNINEATVAQLSGLPGIGEKIAERIVEYRNAKGSFRSTEELQNVKGIGKKMFAKIKPFVEI